MVNHMYVMPHWTAYSRSAISGHVLRSFKNCCSMHLTKFNIESGPQQLQTIHQTVDEFLQSFTEHLQHIILHDFIAKVQTLYYQDLRDNMLGEKVVLVGDFAEKMFCNAR